MKRLILISFVTAVGLILAYSFLTEKTVTMEDYLAYKIEKKKNAKPTYGNPDEAMKWYYEQRAYPLGYIPPDWRQKAFDHIKSNNLQKQGNIEALNWTQQGPGNVGGRVRAIVIHPANPDIVYAGAVSGGVWKTTNGGTSWFPLKDNMENLAVCSMVMDPNNPDIIYAGTGEGYFNGDAIRGEGIFKTIDAGASWTRLGSTFNQKYYYVNKLVIDKNNNTLYAGTRKGLFKSADGGNTFTDILVGSGGGDVHCTDIEIAYTAPTTIYAALGLFNQGTIWRSNDGGNSFVQNYTQSGHGRIEMSVAESDPSIAYASFCNLSSYGVGFMAKTTNAGDSWTSITIPGPSYAGANNYAGTQAWYDNILFNDPDNSSILFAGGIDLWRSSTGGTSWIQISNWYSQAGAPQYVHADQHAIAFAPSNKNIVYAGNDGGVYKSVNRGQTWNAVNNNIFITQFYYGAVAPTGNNFYGGTQDNGTIASNGMNWGEIIGGDGGATEVDFNNPNIIYGEYVRLAFFKSVNGGASFTKKMNGIPVGPNYWDGTTDRTLFISPFTMDPNNSNILAAGTYRVFRTVNSAENWTAISGDLTGDGTGTSGASISAITIAKGNSNVIYVGCSNGRVQVTTNAGTNWNIRETGLPNAYCTKIATDPNNPAIAYAAFSGFSGGQKIFKTNNYGESWTNISSNIPNIPVNCIFINPTNVNNIYIGTDLGVFSTEDGGGSWIQNINGLANVSVADLDYRSSDNTLFAATHGRSMYSASLTGGGSQTFSLIYDDGDPFGGYNWSAAGASSANRITPTIVPAKLVSMSIYITTVSAGNATYTPIVLNNSNGPGSNLAVINPRTAVNIPGWDETDLNPYNITVNDEFYVGLTYDGINQPNFGYDPVNNGRAWDNDGSGWVTWDETYFMRATIQTITSVAEIDNSIPDKFELTNNYPNPFNPSTRFKYALPEGQHVKIIIYDINGSKVTELVNNFQNAGTYEITWNGKNDNGVTVASGTYIYQVQAGKFSETKKMILLK